MQEFLSTIKESAPVEMVWILLAALFAVLFSYIMDIIV
jgi:hypothetical protein